MKMYQDESAGICLRLMDHRDTDSIIAWRNSEAVRKNFIFQERFTREGHEDWVRTMVDTGRAVQMMICDRNTGEAVGSVYVRDIDRRNNKAEYGIFIGESRSRGRGIGTAAARLMIRYCFGELKLHRLFLRVYADNMQAIRSYEKAGFVREAYLREDVCVGGKYRDIVLMAVLDENESGAEPPC